MHDRLVSRRTDALHQCFLVVTVALIICVHVSGKFDSSECWE